MLTNIQHIFDEYWDEYVADCADWQRKQLHPSLKDFVQWLEEKEIAVDEIEPVYSTTPAWEDR